MRDSSQIVLEREKVSKSTKSSSKAFMYDTIFLACFINWRHKLEE